MLDKRLLELRKKENLTQDGISKKIGVARTTYSGYERGTSEPDNETLNKLADLFCVTVDFLLGRELSFVENVKRGEGIKEQAAEYGPLTYQEKLMKEIKTWDEKKTEKFWKLTEVLRDDDK